MPAALPHKKAIANKVRRMIRDGVQVRDIMAAIQPMKDAPSSLATFYKTYGHDMADERAAIVGMVGNKVVSYDGPAREGRHRRWSRHHAPRRTDCRSAEVQCVLPGR